jgi:hypothetical protein
MNNEMSDFIKEIVPVIEKALKFKGVSEDQYKFFETADEGIDNADIAIFPDDIDPDNAIWIAQWIRITKDEYEDYYTISYFMPGRRGEPTEYKFDEYDDMKEAVIGAMAEMLRVDLIELL